MTMLVKGSQRAQLWLSKECQKRVVWDDRARKGSRNSPALAPSGVSEEGSIRDDDARSDATSKRLLDFARGKRVVCGESLYACDVMRNGHFQATAVVW